MGLKIVEKMEIDRERVQNSAVFLSCILLECG